MTRSIENQQQSSAEIYATVHIGQTVLLGSGATLAIWLCAVSLWALPLTTPLNPPPSRTVQGEILKIQGDVYLIKPMSPGAGKEIRLRIDEKTVRIDAESFKVGDVIIADVSPEGHVLVVTPLMRDDTSRPDSSRSAATR